MRKRERERERERTSVTVLQRRRRQRPLSDKRRSENKNERIAVHISIYILTLSLSLFLSIRCLQPSPPPPLPLHSSTHSVIRQDGQRRSLTHTLDFFLSCRRTLDTIPTRTLECKREISPLCETVKKKMMTMMVVVNRNTTTKLGTLSCYTTCPLSDNFFEHERASHLSARLPVYTYHTYHIISM